MFAMTVCIIIHLIEIKQAMVTLQGMAEHRFSNVHLSCDTSKQDKFTPSVGENHTPLVRNGIAAIPKIMKRVLSLRK